MITKAPAEHIRIMAVNTIDAAHSLLGRCVRADILSAARSAALTVSESKRIEIANHPACLSIRNIIVSASKRYMYFIGFIALSEIISPPFYHILCEGCNTYFQMR